MEAKELMIGDWVLDGTNMAQVTGITCDGIIETTFNESSNIEVIEPIRLTPEILEKNGFKKYNLRCFEGEHQWTWWLDMTTSISLWYREPNDNPKDGMMVRVESLLVSFCVRVDCLHQLQHALKLCGIKKEIEL